MTFIKALSQHKVKQELLIFFLNVQKSPGKVTPKAGEHLEWKWKKWRGVGQILVIKSEQKLRKYKFDNVNTRRVNGVNKELTFTHTVY